MTDFRSTVLHAVAYRHTSPGRPPLSGRGSQQFGGRWNRRGGSAAIYLADSFQTCVAEFRRMTVGQGRGSASLLSRDLHHIALDGVQVADLAAPRTLEASGIGLNDILDEDWSKCQQVGEEVARAGFSGLLVPSATGIGHVIVLFEAQVPAGQVHVVKTEQLGVYL